MSNDLQNSLNLILAEKTNKIIPENLKSGVMVYNVIGNYIPSSSENVAKLFNSIANMQADPTAQLDDLAIVYGTQIEPSSSGDTISSIFLSNTVTLNTTIFLTPIRASIRGNSVYLECTLNRTSYKMQDMMGRVPTVTYTSTNGRVYTRTDSGNEIIDFGEKITLPINMNTSLIQFFQAINPIFDGIYQYSTNNQYERAKTQFTVTSENMYNMIAFSQNGPIEGTLQQTTNLTRKQVITRANLYSDLSTLYLDENITDLSKAFNSCRSLITIPNFDTSNVISMENMFSGCSYLTTVPNLNTSNVTSMAHMFSACNNLTTVPNFNTSNVTNIANMFENCYNLTTVPNFDMSNLTNTWAMFQYCNNLTTVPNFDMSNVTITSYMFNGCTNLISVPNFDMSNVRYMAHMFYGCSNLTTVPNFNIKSLTSLETMFYGCSNLTTVPNFDTSNITSMKYMFYNCRNLTTVPNFNTSNVTDMTYMFSRCNNLTTVPQFNTNKLAGASHMFEYCYNLTIAPNLDTSNATNMQSMFSYCNNLTTVSNFDTSNVTSMSMMFQYCNNLTTVPQFNTKKVTSVYEMFRQCNKLSDASIQNIINMCLNSNITNTTQMNLSNECYDGPFIETNISNTRYQNRWAELTAAGWSY